MDFFTRLSPSLLSYKMYRWFGYEGIQSMTLTHSVTAACQSQCKTCGIGHRYRTHPARADDNLTLDEAAMIFESMRPVYFFNISGAEQRAEFFNAGNPITPDAARYPTYQRLMKDFAKKIEANIGGKKTLTKTTEALRLVYYGTADYWSEKRRLFPVTREFRTPTSIMIYQEFKLRRRFFCFEFASFEFARRSKRQRGK
jgi:hypothetical protein